MAARSKARKRALDLLYASEMRRESPTVALDRAIEAGEGPTNDYTSELVRGVVDHQTRIDGLLSDYAEGWSLERMPAIDRNVLRLGVWELAVRRRRTGRGRGHRGHEPRAGPVDR